MEISKKDSRARVRRRARAGVDFGACKFVNNCTSALADSITGIYSYNSGFGVNSLCHSNVIPCDDTIHSEFNGLKYGIKAICSGVLKYIKIDDCLFSNNLRSVYLSGINVPEITRNTIHTKIATQTIPSCGIYLDNSTGYSLQENTITGNYNGSNTYETGIIINNSGTADNLVYNNILSFLQEGIKAQNINRSSNGITGLVCKCNDFTGNKSDEVVFLSQQNQNWGIALYQGDSLSETGPAGNTFSQRSMIKTYDLQNQGARFKYYHQPNTSNKRLKPETQFCSNVYIKQVIYAYYEPTSCPSKLSNGNGIPIEEANEYLHTINGTIEQKESELYTLVDGGSTEEITENIVNSVPPEALELRDNLLSKSPYLSDTAMQTAVSNEFVLPNVMIRDILVANPQSAGSESVLNELDKRIDPMPEDMYNQILAGESVYSPLEVKEMELASLKLERAQLFDYLLASKMTDTTVSLIDSLTTFLQNEQTLEAKYLLATQQIYHGDTVDAFNTLESIPVDFELSPQQQTVYTEYNSYAAILKNIVNDTLCGMQADSIQTVALMALVEEAHEPIKSYARNMLLSIGRVKYSEPYLYSDELKSERIKKEHKMNPSQQNDYLKIYPNPANSYIIVVYNLEKLLDEFVSTASIEISSIQGQVIKKIILDRKIDQKVVSTQLLFPGIYVVSLKVRDKTIETKKVNIIHP